MQDLPTLCHFQEQENVFNEVAIASCLGVYVLLGCFLLWAVRENLIVF